MLWGCVNAYQDEEALRVTLPVLARVVDRIVLVDGAYMDFPKFDKSTWASTDGTVNIARNHGALVLDALPDIDECQKRTMYFVGQAGDWYLVVDADEIVEGSPDMAAVEENGADDWWIKFSDEDAPWQVERGRRVLRLHRHRPGMRYDRAHNALYVPDASAPRGIRCVLDESLPIAPGVSLVHAKDRIRPRWREIPKPEYYEKLKVAEAGFRTSDKF